MRTRGRQPDRDVRRHPAAAGARAPSTYSRTVAPNRPVRCGARKLTTNRLVGEPPEGLTVIRARPGPEAIASAGKPRQEQHADARHDPPRHRRESTRVTRARLHATFTAPGRLAQLGERRLDKAEVAGSSPASSIGPILQAKTHHVTIPPCRLVATLSQPSPARGRRGSPRPPAGAAGARARAAHRRNAWPASPRCVRPARRHRSANDPPTAAVKRSCRAAGRAAGHR